MRATDVWATSERATSVRPASARATSVLAASARATIERAPSVRATGVRKSGRENPGRAGGIFLDFSGGFYFFRNSAPGAILEKSGEAGRVGGSVGWGGRAVIQKVITSQECWRKITIL